MSDAAFEKISAVGTEHERLAPFAGTFRAEVKIWFRPGDPVVSTGTMVNSWVLGGMFLKQVYTGDPAPDGSFPAFEGRGYWGYNTISRCYEGFWIDNASTMMQTDTGSVDASGRVWTMSGVMANPQSREPMTKRSVITLVDQDTHRIEVFFATGGAPETRSMEIIYRRTESPARS